MAARKYGPKKPTTEPRRVAHEQPLLQFVTEASPELVPPVWLEPLILVLETLPGSGRRVVVAIPVRHGKTTALHHAIVKWILANPALSVVYWTYSLSFAYENNKAMSSLYQRCGGRLERNTQAKWTTPQGGGVYATSVEGGITGRGGDVLVIDDPVKNRAEVENAERREGIDTALRHDAITRLRKDSPIILVASRWHQDDPSGRMLKRGWEHIHMRAVEEQPDGSRRALWPDERPLEYLDRTREEIGEYGFAALYQGEPTPPTSSLFGGITTYPTDGRVPLRIIIGVDLGYSRRGDYTAMVVLGDFFDHYRILDVVRGQWNIQETRAQLHAMRARWPQVCAPNGVRWVSYVSGPERGVYDLLLEEGIVIERIPARFSKLQRAQRASGGWIAGRIRVPESSPAWLEPFISELRYFTGEERVADDQVDSLVGAYDAAEGARSTYGMQPGMPIGLRVM